MKRVTITFQAVISDEEYQRDLAPELPGETSLDRARREFAEETRTDLEQRVLSVVVEDVIAVPAPTNIPA